MSNIKDFIESGILEMYVLGIASEEETSEVGRMAAIYPEIEAEIESISIGMENYAMAHAVVPDPAVKSLIFASIKDTVPAAFPPVLNKDSKKEHYDEWLNHTDYQLPDDFVDAYSKVIGSNDDTVIAVAWLRGSIPYEVHHKELEKFLILEGECDVNIGDKVYRLGEGDYLEIPLYIEHNVVVTSEVPCKAIFQITTLS